MQFVLWNIVGNNVQVDEPLQRKLWQKITRLEKHLKGFPAEKVHLQLLLEKPPRKALHRVTLTLQLPADILRAEKSAPELLKGFDEALEALRRKLEAFQSGHQGEELQKYGQPRPQAPTPEWAGFAAEPQSPGSGPQQLKDLIRQFFKHHYRSLLHHARRDMRHDELAGALPGGVLDARDLVAEVARRAEAHPNRKPEKMSWRVWLYHLLHEELRRQRRRLREERATEVSTEQRTTLPELKPEALQPEEEMVEKVLEPQPIQIEDVVPDPNAVPPDQIVEEKELLEQLQDTLRSWPPLERELFELYFVQGFEPQALAQITRQPLKKVKDTLLSIQRRLREELREEEAAA
jgi:ribosomal subunit interface protein